MRYLPSKYMVFPWFGLLKSFTVVLSGACEQRRLPWYPLPDLTIYLPDVPLTKEHSDEFAHQ